MRKLVINLALHAWCWQCRSQAGIGPNWFQDLDRTQVMFYSAGTAFRDTEDFRPFVEYALKHCRNIIHACKSLTAMSEFLAGMTSEEFVYAIQLMNKYYATPPESNP